MNQETNKFKIFILSFFKYIFFFNLRIINNINNTNYNNQNIQRYFRVPFIKPTEETDYSLINNNPSYIENYGFWLAHFDGEYIARQIELYPSKPPLLLTAGIIFFYLNNNIK